MDQRIAIAEVAAKLGLRRESEGDFIGPNPFTGSRDCDPFVLWDNTLENRGEAIRANDGYGVGSGYDCATQAVYTVRQVCALAGVDYERYEGREVEPRPSAETVNAELLAACKALFVPFFNYPEFDDWEWGSGEPMKPELERMAQAIAQAEAAST